MSAVALLLALASANAPHERCAVDRLAMLALDQRRFDQDIAGGWRPLADLGCDLAAADLIAAWRAVHASAHPDLFWHEGQMRANAGQTDAAIALFERARHPAATDAIGWNLYVDGTIAFLRRDRTGLLAARDRLARLPAPKDWHPNDPDGKPVRIAWPLNLNVLDGFLQCWDASYRDAYAAAPGRSLTLRGPRVRVHVGIRAVARRSHTLPRILQRTTPGRLS